MKFEIDMGLLKKTKKIRSCVKNNAKHCPCDDFLENYDCKCEVFKKI